MASDAAKQAVSRDPDAAREFAENYGVNANAEDIIRSNQARVSRELRIAQRINTVDESETEKLKFSGAAKAVGVEEDQVRGYAVRGGFLVVVYEDERGDVRKVAVPHKGTKFEKTPEDEAADAEVNAQASVMKAAREAREEQQRLLNEAQRQGQQQAAEKVQEAVEAAQQEQQKAAEKAEQAREKDS